MPKVTKMSAILWKFLVSATLQEPFWLHILYPPGSSLQKGNAVETLQSVRHYANTATNIGYTTQHSIRDVDHMFIPVVADKFGSPTTSALSSWMLYCLRAGFKFVAAPLVPLQHCYNKLTICMYCRQSLVQKCKLDHILGSLAVLEKNSSPSLSSSWLRPWRRMRY